MRRSHSQEDSRAGRPNTSRNPSLPMCGSTNCEAAVSSGTSGKRGLTPAAEDTASMSSSAERRRGMAWEKLSRSLAFHSLVTMDA